MTKRLLIFCLFFSLFTAGTKTASASDQLPDYLVYKADTFATYHLLVEQYLQSREKVPSDKLFGLSFRAGSSMNCWRAYQAIYRIENDSIFVVAMIGCFEQSDRNIDTAASAKRMKELFGERVIEGKVFIDWFSGDISFPLRDPANKLLRRGIAFYFIYEKEKVFGILGGKVIDIRDVDNYEAVPKGINRRDRKVLPDILFRQLKTVSWKRLDTCNCSDKYRITIGADGRVSGVIMPEYPNQDSIDAYWDPGQYDYCIGNVLKAVKKLRFDLIKDKGRPIPETVYLEIWFRTRRKIENWTD